MIRMILGLGVSACLFGGTTALAKPHDPHKELKLERITAIHAPTGCRSAVEYDDGNFVQAFITDPLCLPYGVTERSIPSTERDFFAPPPMQAAVTGQ